MPKIRVLLIEDNPAQAELVTELLSDAGSAKFEVTHAERLETGLQLIADERFDVVLQDLGLPDSQGVEGIDRVLGQRSDLPIVVLTNLDDHDNVGVDALQRGAQDYVVKGSLDGDGLHRVLRYAIERGRLRQQLEEAQRHEIERLEAIERVKQLEHVEAMNAYKTTLLNAVAHELNTPLTPIRLQMDLLANGRLGDLNEKQTKAFSRLSSNFTRLCDVVDDVLRAIRMQDQAVDILKTPIDLGRLAQETIEACKDDGVNAIVQTKPHATNGRVAADEARIRFVIESLLRFAQRHTMEAGHVEVHVERRDHDVVVETKTEGRVLTREQCAALFDHTGTAAVDHTGHGAEWLALPVADQIIRMHGGRIWCTPREDGRGNIMAFSIPCETKETDASQPGPAQDTSQPSIENPATHRSGTRQPQPPAP